ncbi:organic cation transporter protein [Elysia marginata]|uniref:Organic cation transporter protein n=1 Tax=Elysia marginata TaxID=1093978 RepID=A0AAV4GAP3_9GAST|nr:organic cation transporter protein [Elysia marginata]
MLCHFGTVFGTAWVKSYPVYVALRFCTTFFGTGAFLTAFVIGMEFVGPSQRRVAGIVIELSWCDGLFLETGIAWLLRDGRYFQMTISVFSVLIALVLALFVPESARWLLQKGKNEEARKIIMKAAKVNGVTLSKKAEKLNIEVKGEGETIWQMFTYPALFARCLIVFGNW